jgi:hypothetical protein
LRSNAHLCRRKNDFHAAHTHTRPRAAGVSPPWAGEPNAVPRISRTVHRPRDAQTRAAGVSPPWAGKIASAYTPAIRRQTADGVCADCRCIRVYRRHGGLTPPALAVERASLPAKKRFLRCTSAHPTKSGGRQPAVGRQNRIRIHARYSSADRRRCVCGLPLHSRLSAPRGANAPRSCVGTRISAGEKTIFTLHIRTSDQERRALARRAGEPNAVPRISRIVHRPRDAQTRAAASARRGQRQNRITHNARLAIRGMDRRVCGLPQHSRFPAPRLAHASRSYLKTRMLLVICVSYLRVRYSLHGWLTPAAPGCATCVRRKIRGTMRTPEQERRASARRGNETYTQRQPSWRESDFLAGEWPTVRSNRSRKSPASLMLDAVAMR